MSPYSQHQRGRLHPSAYENLDDEQLIDRAQGEDAQGTKDNEAYMALLDRHEGLITYLTSKHIYSKRRFEDMRQEASLAFLRAVETYDASKDVQFKTYASTCITNALISENRKKPYVADLTIIASEDLEEPFEIAGDLDVEAEVEHSIQAERIKEVAREHLSKLEQQVLLLSLDGFSNQEIEKILDFEGRRVANALDRAKRKIKALLFRN